MNARVMRGAVLLVAVPLVAVLVKSVLWQPTPPIEPTAEQLQKARDEYAKIGATYEAVTDPLTKRVPHLFRISPRTKDADLKNLPNPPFSFALSLTGTQVTDVGLAELKDLKNLTSLNLVDTQVTDVGLKELREALPKCQIIR